MARDILATPVSIPNAYEDRRRAEAYATLEFRGTYYLAYRDLPEILAAQVKGTRAIDFGCGAGRSARFLERLGFDAVGVDISTEMIARARQLDPDGDYRLLDSRGLSAFEQLSHDLVLSYFPFDNVPRENQKVGRDQEPYEWVNETRIAPWTIYVLKRIDAA